MATRKDLLKAHKFTGSRLVAALVDRDPDRIDSPLRRIAMGTFASIMIGVVIMAGFGVAGLLLNGSGTTWKDSDNLVVIDSQAGQVFWYRKPAGAKVGVLYPMENITSALLASGGAEVQSMKSNSLRGVERGERLGIAGAPGQLPAAADLGFYPAQVCATAPDAKTAERSTTLSFGEASKRAGDDTPMVLVDADGNNYLVIAGTAHLVPKKPGDALPALLLQMGYPRIDKAYGVLSTLPVGSVLSSARILDGVTGLGENSSNPAGKAQRVGDLVRVTGSDESYLLLSSGLARIRPLELKTLQADNRPLYELSAADVAKHLAPAEERERGATDLPATLPPVPDGTELESLSVCSTWSDADSAPVLAFGVETPAIKVPQADPRLADIVNGLPGKGALLANNATEAEPASAVLVVDGRRYGIPDAASLAALGYASAPKDRVPPAIMALIPAGLPSGTGLSIEDAGKPPVR